MDTVIAGPAVETGYLVGVLFVAVEVLKGICKIEGQTRKVQLIALLLGLAFALGDALSAGGKVPPITFPLIWNAIIRGLVITGAAMGVNSARNNNRGDDPPPGSPLDAVAKAVDTATAATTQVKEALQKADAAMPAAADEVAALPPAPDATLADFAPGSEADTVSALMLGYNMPEAEATRIVRSEPMIARVMLAKLSE